MILHHHYVRDESIYTHERLGVQLASILIIAGATGTWPDALVGSILYQDIEFRLFPSSPGGKRTRLGLVAGERQKNSRAAQIDHLWLQRRKYSSA